MSSLSVKYRPTEFEDVCGQESTVKILNRQINTENISNAYLFCGASGCGKTTVARILANKINKGLGSPIEIDAASNSGVDNVRNIIDRARERSLDSKYKVFIIDECHGLSNTAWQSFLKCIEEPPQYTIFIFCTTDPQKVPNTIVNRCMRFNFNRIKPEVISDRLKYICEQEGFEDYQEGCEYLSKLCAGEMRQGIALLEQCSRYDTHITVENVLKALGDYSYDSYFKLINSIVDDNETEVLSTINDIYNSGIDLRLFVEQFLEFCLDIAKYALLRDCRLVKIPSSMKEQLEYTANITKAVPYYMYVVNNLLELKNVLKTDNSPKATVEIYLLNIARMEQK